MKPITYTLGDQNGNIARVLTDEEKDVMVVLPKIIEIQVDLRKSVHPIDALIAELRAKGKIP